MKNNSGFIAITTVLILSAVALTIGITVTALSIGQGQAGLAIYNGEKELILAESCLEVALQSIRTSATYAGGAVTLPSGTCQISISKAGNVWTVSSTTNTTSYRRSIRAVFTRSGTGLVLTLWQET